MNKPEIQPGQVWHDRTGRVIFNSPERRITVIAVPKDAHVQVFNRHGKKLFFDPSYLRRHYNFVCMTYPYRVIRLPSGEAFAMVNIPIYCDIMNLYSTHFSIYSSSITKAQYTSYKELGLFPVYKWVHSVPNERFVDVYDPNHYAVKDGKVVKLLRL